MLCNMQLRIKRDNPCIIKNAEYVLQMQLCIDRLKNHESISVSINQGSRFQCEGGESGGGPSWTGSESTYGSFTLVA